MTPAVGKRPRGTMSVTWFSKLKLVLAVGVDDLGGDLWGYHQRMSIMGEALTWRLTRSQLPSPDSQIHPRQ